MYNLLIMIDDEKKFWIENSEYKIKNDRLFEYTDEEIKEKYMKDLDRLRNLPCLFAYEIPYKKEETKGHIGYIQSIREYNYPGYHKNGKKIHIEYKLDHTYPDIYINKKDISALEDLGIDKPTEPWELTRTHWAVKKRNLFKFLAKSLLKRFNIEPTPTHSEMKQIWEEDYINKTLCFLSHKAEYKKQVSQIKEKLKTKNINCFVAHQDIEPSLEWQKEIIKALNTMHIFIGIVTDDFHEGSWTDQEIGYAYKRKIPRILVKLDNLPPQGFVSSEQALTASWSNIHEKIIEQIKKIP